jgi:hypothetical protein
LEDLKTVALPECRPILERQLKLLASSTNHTVRNSRDAIMGLTPDPMGFGVHAGIGSFADDAELSENGAGSRPAPAEPEV